MTDRWSRYDRWIAILLPPVLVGIVEFLRHEVFEGIIPENMGILVTVGVALVASAIVVGGVFALMERARREAESRRRALSLFEERDRIASALHDGISQTLFFANVELTAAQEAVERGDAGRSTAHLAEGRFAVQAAHDDVRQAIFNLRSMRAPGGEILETLRDYAEEHTRQTGVPVRLICREPGYRLAPEAETALLQVVRESLWNIRKHAYADEVAVTCSHDPDGCRLEVADNGSGFDVGAVRSERRTFGLRIMEERALLAGGGLEIDSSPGRGTRVRLALPRNAMDATPAKEAEHVHRAGIGAHPGG